MESRAGANEYAGLDPELLDPMSDSVFNNYSVDQLFSFIPTSITAPSVEDDQGPHLLAATHSTARGAGPQEPATSELAMVLDTVSDGTIIEYLRKRTGTWPTLRASKDRNKKISQEPLAVSQRPEHRRREEGTNRLDRQDRQHHAVEKRYRSGLNKKYTKLTEAILQDRAQRICQTLQKDWNLQFLQDSGRLNKTATLSAALDTIDILVQCCERKARELEALEGQRRQIDIQVRRLLHNGLHETL